MRVLIVTKIFPNAREPLSSPFNRQQFAALAERCDVDVLATVPWFPGRDRGKPPLPRSEVIDGLPVRHPRTLYLPRIGHAVAPALYLASLAPELARARGRCDVVLGSWAYPDGVAAIGLGRLLGVPAVVKLHGSDVNVVGQMRLPRAIMARALPRAAAVIAVSRALAGKARELGVPGDQIWIVYNGVDGELFRVRDRGEARRALGLPAEARIALYVGNLKESKGVRDLARAFPAAAKQVAGLHLAIVGDGGERTRCDQLAAELPGRVTVAGARPLAEIPTWMAACDLLVLPSWNEGTPNVVLEALACGRRVVATAVGGVPDVIDDGALGALVAPREPDQLAAALAREAVVDYRPDEVARRGGRGDWEASADRLFEVLERVVGR